MQLLGREKVKERATFWFNNIVKRDSEEFVKEAIELAYMTFFSMLNDEKIEDSPDIIKVGGMTLKKCDNLLDMQVKYLIEAVNLRLEDEWLIDHHMLAACFYRKDWSKPFNKNEYFEVAKAFYYSPVVFALYAQQLFNKLILNLQENYPVLYGGSSDEEKTDGRKMYDLLNNLSGNDPTKQEIAENLPIFRAFTWMEQNKIDEINRKNKG